MTSDRPFVPGLDVSRILFEEAVEPLLDRARFGVDWRERETSIVNASQLLANVQNELAIAEPVDPTPRRFVNRPFQVMFAERFSDALVDAISDPDVLALPRHLGGVDQYIDTTDGREWIDLHLAIRRCLASGGS